MPGGLGTFLVRPPSSNWFEFPRPAPLTPLWPRPARYNEDQLRRARSLDEKIQQARARRKAKGLDADEDAGAAGEDGGAGGSESESGEDEEEDEEDEDQGNEGGEAGNGGEGEEEEEEVGEAASPGEAATGAEGEEEGPAAVEESGESEGEDGTGDTGFFQSEGAANREVAESLARRHRSQVLADQGIEEETGGRDESFAALHLSRPLLRAVSGMGFDSPTPIQRRVVPLALAGKDVCASAQTGSGKTAAFLLPLLERLLFRSRRVAATRVLVVAPTRELATQCRAMMGQLAQFTDVRSALVVGGLSLKEQEAELRTRPDVVICTPGRMIDHLRNSSAVDVDDLEALVLDEADRLLELGFQDEARPPRAAHSVALPPALHTPHSHIPLSPPPAGGADRSLPRSPPDPALLRHNDGERRPPGSALAQAARPRERGQREGRR